MYRAGLSRLFSVHLQLLLRLTKEATPEGKIKAAHAIARLGSEVKRWIFYSIFFTSAAHPFI